ncbi:hypothetical protein RRG08_038276 [Elysia crispata]|uniref:Uncharacterized protein n=1 Tax=Elysia crispata TaxID=231223 RepID=A0AAE1E248_9GAST|nr:hypothetical protein RRG08_038276 [Elysia crispata]
MLFSGYTLLMTCLSPVRCLTLIDKHREALPDYHQISQSQLEPATLVLSLHRHTSFMDSVDGSLNITRVTNQISTWLPPDILTTARTLDLGVVPLPLYQLTGLLRWKSKHHRCNNPNLHLVTTRYLNHSSTRDIGFVTLQIYQLTGLLRWKSEHHLCNKPRLYLVPPDISATA